MKATSCKHRWLPLLAYLASTATLLVAFSAARDDEAFQQRKLKEEMGTRP